MLTRLQAAAESCCQHERVNDTPLRNVGCTQVSASTQPQGQWQSDAYETKQRRINLVMRHRGRCYSVDSLSISPSLSIRALNYQVNKQRWTRREIQWVTSLSARPCWSVICVPPVLLEIITILNNNWSRHESFNCNVVTSKHDKLCESPSMQTCRCGAAHFRFTADLKYYITHFVQ